MWASTKTTTVYRSGWGDVDEAKRIIVECIERAKKVGF